MTAERAGSRSLLLYLGCAVVLFVPALWGGQVLAFRDLADYAIPHKLFAVREALGASSRDPDPWPFRVPLWNPFNFFGFPHLANLQSGVLYPPNLLLLLGFPLGINLTIALHYVIAAWGAERLARQLGMGRVGGWVAGMGYGFSPYLASLTDLNAFLFTSSWLPWMIREGLRMGRKPGAARIATASPVFGIAFLAGEPQTFAVGCLVAALASLPASMPRAREALGLIGGWTLAALLALLLAAPVLLPFLELVGSSERAGGGMSPAEVYRYSLEPEGLATLVFPGFAGDPARGTHWLGSQTYVRSPYLGVSLLALAALGLLARTRLVAWLALGGGLGLALALGPRGLVYPLLYSLGFRQSRFPVKFLIFTVLAVALLGGLGAERLDRKARGGSVARGLAMVLALLAAGALVLLAGANGGPPRAALVHTLVVSLLALVAMGLAAGRSRPAMAVLLAGDLLVAARPLLTTTSGATLLASNEVVDAIRDAGKSEPCRAWPRAYTPVINEELLRFVYPRGRHEPESLERKKALLFGNMNLLFGLPVVRGGESVEVTRVSRFLELLDRGPEARRLLDLAGVRWFVTDAELGGLGLIPVLDGPVKLYENPTVLPHAFLVERAGGGEPGRRLLAPDFDPAREAILADPPPGLDPGCARGTARVVACSAREVRIAVSSPGRCVLVLTDTDYPGWQALVDGEAQPIRNADLAFRAVVVGPETREVRFRYRPRSYARGLELLCLGLGLWAVVALLAGRSARRGRAT